MLEVRVVPVPRAEASRRLARPGHGGAEGWRFPYRDRHDLLLVGRAHGLVHLASRFVGGCQLTASATHGRSGRGGAHHHDADDRGGEPYCQHTPRAASAGQRSPKRSGAQAIGVRICSAGRLGNGGGFATVQRAEFAGETEQGGDPGRGEATSTTAPPERGDSPAPYGRGRSPRRRTPAEIASAIVPMVRPVARNAGGEDQRAEDDQHDVDSSAVGSPRSGRGEAGRQRRSRRTIARTPRIPCHLTTSCNSRQARASIRTRPAASRLRARVSGMRVSASTSRPQPPRPSASPRSPALTLEHGAQEGGYRGGGGGGRASRRRVQSVRCCRRRSPPA